MTDYTTTPNLGLFKPVVDADENFWGDHINFNADKLDQFFGGSTAGPFLPLTGGTVSPNGLTISNTPNNAPGVTVTPIGMYDIAPPSTTKAWRGNIESYVNVGTNGGHFSDATTNSVFGITTIYGAPNNNCWGLTAVTTFQGTGGNGHHVALTGYGNRNTAAAQPTTTVAVTLSAPSNVLQLANVTNFQVPYAMPIVINGKPNLMISVSGTSGPGSITVLDQVSVADGTAGNTVQGNNNPQIWGSNIYAVDRTNLDSQHTNSTIGLELDIAANGLDNAGYYYQGSPGGIRSGLVLVGLKGTPGGADAEIANGIVITAGANTTYKRGILMGANTRFNQAAFDTRSAVQLSGAHMVWLGDNQHVAWNTAGDATTYFDPAIFSGLGGLRIRPNAQIDGNLTLISATGDDPMRIQVASGHYGRIKYIMGSQSWSAGVWPDASWRVSNETAVRIDFSISSNGNATFAGSCSFFGATPPSKPTGYTTPTGTATRATFATGSVTLPQLAEHVKALIDDLTAYGLIGA